MKTKLLFIMLLLMATMKMNAQWNYEWARRMGGVSPDNAYGIAVDNDGNVLTCGEFYETVDFDPSEEGEALLTSIGSDNGFVSKLDAQGNFAWARSIVGESSVFAVATDEDGNVYCGGNFRNTVDFLAGEEEWLLSTPGYTDGFLAKYTSDGIFLWAHSFGSVYHDHVAGITLDESANLIVYGDFTGIVDFDFGDGELVLEKTSESLDSDAFVAKYDQDGNVIWAKQFAGQSLQYATGAEVNSEGDIVVAGYFNINIDCDPGPGELIFENGSESDRQCYAVKLSPEGDLIWGKSFGGAGQDVIYAMAVDEQDNVYATGQFYSTADFNPGGEVFEMTAPSFVSDAFIIKLDTDGNFVWAKQFESTSTGAMAGQDIDVLGGIVYSTGYVSEVCDFDPNAGQQNLGALGSLDIYISALDSDGEYLWADRMGSSQNDMGFAIVVDEQYVYNTGYFSHNSVGFGNSDWFNSNGFSDVFVCKIQHPLISSVHESRYFDIEVYPNPAHNAIVINGISSQSNIVMYDITGKMVLNENVINNASLDISALDAGIYIITIVQDDMCVTKKIIVE